METIRDIRLKIKLLWARLRENALLVAALILLVLLAFGLGRLSVLYGEKGDLKIIYLEDTSGL